MMGISTQFRDRPPGGTAKAIKLWQYEIKNPELWAVGSRTAKNGIRRALIPASVKVVSKTRIREPEICVLDYGAVGAVYGTQCTYSLRICTRNIVGGVVSHGVSRVFFRWPASDLCLAGLCSGGLVRRVKCSHIDGDY